MKIKFTDLQLRKISDILVVIGEVMFAVIVIPYFLDIQNKDGRILFVGLLVTATSWVLSVIIVQKAKL